MSRSARVTRLAVALGLVGALAAASWAWASLRPTGEPPPRVRDESVPGPAVGVSAGNAGGSPNRLGSPAVPVRIYEPGVEPWGTLVWAHGGSFVRGTLDWPEADWVARRFAEAGLRVYSVDYALASDTVKAPAPANDVAAVVHAAAERHAGALFVGGASAGAHLAVEAVLTQHDAAVAGRGRVADALIMLYPTAHRTQRADPAIDAATAQLPEARRFDPQRIADMYAFYLGADEPAGGGTAVAGGPLAYPTVPVVVGELPVERLAQLPATVIVNAEADDLRASGEQFAEQLHAAGVPVVHETQPATVHGFLNRPNESSSAEAASRATIERFVRALRAIHPQ